MSAVQGRDDSSATLGLCSDVLYCIGTASENNTKQSFHSATEINSCQLADVLDLGVLRGLTETRKNTICVEH